MLDDGVEELGVGVGVDRDGDGGLGADVVGISGGGAGISLPDSRTLSCNKMLLSQSAVFAISVNNIKLFSRYEEPKVQ